MYRLNKILDAALVALMTYHLVISPYTKVEESFNIQAVHDILNYGFYSSEELMNYDHQQFPGVVPRTFVGSLVLAAIAKPIIVISSIFGVNLLQGSQLSLQSLVRGILGLINVLMLMRLRDSVNRITYRDKKSLRKGLIGFWFSVLLLCQFHLVYYASRTLPNFMALPLVNFALSKLIVGDLSGLTWLSFTGIIFRLEVGVFAAIIAVVSSLVFGQSNIFINVIFLVAGAVFGGCTSFVVDSYFWGRYLLPELESFVFNIVDGESVKWGTEPWGAYFGKYLFQLFRPPVILLLVVPGFVNDPAKVENDSNPNKKDNLLTHPARHSLRILFISSLLFIAAMSFQPHKEWRFIIYTVPIFTLQAANGLSNISMKWTLGWSTKLLTIIFTSLTILSALLSIQMGYISSFNYPGGEAFTYVNEIVKQQQQQQQQLNSSQDIFVHLDVSACMTGVTRFGELHSLNVHYDKTETEVDLNSFDFVVTNTKLNNSWTQLHTSKIFDRISIAMFVKILRAQRSDSSTIPRMLRIFVEDFINGSNEALKDLWRSTVVLKDYIYVYRNTQQEQV
ncbi:ECM39 [Candida oxycetoniae]|uniref:Mannosyltransferase n=1 Tax=Candida oxycetoniae TaxID=497107 RepID=A0AAI9WYX5_9ASCO|nr:ECM39 [Candida oxycetoniae]KAI3405469.1 ECM39 [Candida oxycetoniae]